MGEFWQSFLVTPLLNILILFYDTIAFGNLGVAVIELTIALRIILLPLTIVDEKGKAQEEQMDREVARIQESFKGDEVAAHEHVRELLRKHKVNPWAKTLVLFIQLLVLVVLYRVFISGINANLGSLYSWVRTPDIPINAQFFGFEIGQRNFWWALSVGVILYFEIAAEQREYLHILGKQDAVYRYAFPIFSVVILSILPMVKTIFILTSMGFTTLTWLIRRALWPTDSTK